MPATELLQNVTSKFGTLEDGVDVSRFLEGVSKYYGFEFYSVALIPHNEPRRFPQHNLATNWPSELISLFEKKNLIDSGPLVSMVRSTTVPFVYNVGKKPAGEDLLGGREVLNEILQRFNLAYSALFPVCDNLGNRACVSFSGTREDLTTVEFLELFMISTYFQDRMSSIKRQLVEGRESPLSQRELECLRWSAEGKTSSEISQIMSLSEHTINYYLVSAARKLDAVNRIQAVAQSIREGWI